MGLEVGGRVQSRRCKPLDLPLNRLRIALRFHTTVVGLGKNGECKPGIYFDATGMMWAHHRFWRGDFSSIFTGIFDPQMISPHGFHRLGRF